MHSMAIPVRCCQTMPLRWKLRLWMVSDTSCPVIGAGAGIRLDPREDVISEALLLTSDAAYSKAAGYQMTTTDREEGDADGPFALAAYACQQDTGAEVI